MRTPVDVFEKARTHERLEQLAGRPRGGPAALLPPPRGPRRARRGDGGRRADHARLQQLPRPDRATRASSRPPTTRIRPLRHRPDRQPPAQRDDRPAPRARGARSPPGWAPRRRSSPRTGHGANLVALGTLLGPGDTVIADSGDHASILDGILLCRAKMRPFRHNRLDKLEKQLAARRRRRSRPTLVVVDGVFSMEGDIAPLPDIVALDPGARRPADGRRGPRRRRARRARRRRLRAASASRTDVDLRMGTFSKSLASCGGFLAGSHEVIDFLRVQSRAFLFTASAVPAAVGAALAAAADRPLRRGPAAVRPASSTTPRYLRDGLHDLGFQVGDVPRRRVVPVVVGDDWKAVLLWRALYDAGVYVNVALHPAVPPAGRAAAHERDGHPRPRDARPRAWRLRRRQARLRGRARPAANPTLTRAE